ncbi:hypothetical protein RB213_010930 [Colletotrichum asianum]
MQCIHRLLHTLRIWKGIWKREACRTEVHALASTHTRPAFSQDPAAAAASTYHLHGGDGETRPHFCICHDLLSAVSAHQGRQSLNDTIVCTQTRTELLATPTSPPAPGTWTRALAVKLESAYVKPSLQRNATQRNPATLSCHLRVTASPAAPNCRLPDLPTDLQHRTR